MSTQYLRCPIGVAGLTGLVAKVFFFSTDDDTVEYTSDSFVEQTNAVGQYVFAFGESSVIPKTWWRIVIVDGSGNLKGDGYAYFSGADGELVECVGEPIKSSVAVNGSPTVERSISDTKAIAFGWPVSGATITGERSTNQGAYTSVTGAISYLRQDGGVYWYSLAYNAADRGTAETNVRYKFTDGTYTRWVNLRVTGTVALDPAVEAVINDIPNTAEFEARTLAAASYATASQINSLQVNTRASVQVPVEIETPDSGTQIWKIRLFLFDSDGNMEAPDSTPTIALVNASGTDRSSRLSAATTLSTGAYSWDYTATDDDTEEQLNWTFTVVEGGLTRIYPATSYVVEETAYRFTATDRSTLNSRASSTEVTAVGTAVASVSTTLGTPAGASVSADIASIKTDTGVTIPGLFTTLTTKIRKFFQLSLRKDAAIATDNATELTEINANGGSGGGGFLNTTDSQEATVDRGNAAWTTGGGGGGGDSAATMLSTTIATVTSQTVLILTDGSADNDVYNDQLVVITDAVTSTQKARMLVSDYVGSTKTLTLASAPGFTVASGDSIAIIAVAGLTSGQRNQLALIGAGTRMTVKADLGTEISLKIGDAYSAARSTAKRIDVNDSDASIYDMLTADEIDSIDFGLSNATTIDIVTGTVDPETITHTAASGSVSAYTTVYVEVDVDASLKPFCGDYDIQITYDDETRKTAFSGKCELVRDFKA